MFDPTENNQENPSQINKSGTFKLGQLGKNVLKKGVENIPQGNCPYCLRQRVFTIELDCGHSFCSKCAFNLTKITKIKKGIKVRDLSVSLSYLDVQKSW